MRSCCVALLLPALVGAQPPATAIDPDGVRGTRLICGGGTLPDAVMQRFVELAGGKTAKLVVIPTASASGDDPAEQEKLRTRWRERGLEATILHTRDRKEADAEGFSAPLRTATGVWIGGGAQARLADAYLGTAVERELLALLGRGGVVAGTSAGAAIQSRVMIQEGRDPPIVAQGFDFLPAGVLDQHFLKRNRLPRLLTVLGQHPGCFGLGIDEGTAVEVRGRELRVHGASKAVLVLAPGAGREQRTVELGAGEFADLPTWQRAARDRAGSPWPPQSCGEPKVGNGTLVIVGGGRIPPPVLDRFVALAGGAAARIAVVPTAAGQDAHDAAMIRDLIAAGAGTVREFHVRHPREVKAHPELAFLQAATGVWFGGGRQWRLCDAYEDTPALAAFHAVLARGGVIGGSSAGATIQGEFLVRGNPLGNTDMAVEGYERGFGFLPGCAIDQHFLRRNRTADLAGLIGSHRQLLGLGIDEGTAAVVHGSELEVVGDSQIAVFDARRPPAATATAPLEPVMLAPGERWDLVAGTRLPATRR